MFSAAVNIGPREQTKRRMLGIVTLTVGVGTAFALLITEALRRAVTTKGELNGPER